MPCFNSKYMYNGGQLFMVTQSLNKITDYTKQ